jgi:putative MATE family efflux protein
MHAPVTRPTTAAPATWAREMRATLGLAAPLVAANLLQMGVYAVDVIFVARLGTVEFAAATLGVYLYSIISFALLGLVGAAAPVMAAELGRRRHAVREVRRTFRMAIWLAVAASVPFMLLLANGETLFRLAHQDPAVAVRAGAFLDILLFAMVPFTVSVVMRNAASALGRPGWAMAVTAMALGLGILGNWLLVFGHAGFPALGLEGSAIASVVTTCAMAGAYAAILTFDPKLRRYRLFGRWWRTEWSRMGEIVRIGVPVALTMTFEGALFGGAAFLMGLIGVVDVAAHAVALQIAAVSFQVPLGIAQAATIRVGMAYGALDRVWIGRAGAAALVLGIGFMALTTVGLWIAPRLVVSAYLDLNAPENAAVVPLAIRFLAIAALFQLFDGAQVVAAGALRGLQDTRVPMLVAAGGYWIVGFGVAILLGFYTDLRGVGIWIGLASGLAAVAGLLLWRWAARDGFGLTPAPVHRK